MPRVDERTPLIAVVRIAPPIRRYPHHTLRRFCTIVLSAVVLLAFTACVLLFTLPDCNDSPSGQGGNKPCVPKHPFFKDISQSYEWWSRQATAFGAIPPNAKKGRGLNYAELLQTLARTPSEEKTKEWSQYYTAGPHLAGRNLSQAEWTMERWQEFGLKDTRIVAYDTYINYPVSHSLKILDKGNTSEGEFKVTFTASLEEDILREDGTSGLESRVPTFHGYSANGNVTASWVYVNYGTYNDFEDLLRVNISLAGKIALARYGSIFRGLKVKRAQELGMVGVVIYSDPGDDGDVTEQNGHEAYPIGPARESSSVQRGSVQFLSIAPGDPTTPGYPSKPDCPRQSANHSTPSIPSIPISYADALPLLKALNGCGPNAKDFGDHWSHGGLGYDGVEYYVGPSPENLQLNLINEQEYTITPIWNVIGIINGTIPDEVVILGNHRDAWIAGGAGDPNSGSSAFNEVIRGFGAALAQGWKPLRTMVFASWDGEEYGLVGSTEWVEEFLPWLSESAVAYLNVDVGTSGPNFKASAAPLLNKALTEAAKLVLSPNQTKSGQTVYDVWHKQISTMGSGSDFTAFQDFVGVPCVDMGFGPGRDTPVYHYHSNYDSFYWMDNFGDPGWHYHATIARVWAILAANITETPIIPFNATDYAENLARYLDGIKEKMRDSGTFSVDEPDTAAKYRQLKDSIARLRNASVSLDAEAAELLDEVIAHPIPFWKWWDRIVMYRRIQRINARYKYLERQFIYEKGLDERPWYKHAVFAPGIWTGYAGATFPGLVEALDRGDRESFLRWAEIICCLVDQATRVVERA